MSARPRSARSDSGLDTIEVDPLSALYAYQEGRCAVCNEARRLVVDHDHDHDTGLVRGLLCYGCNSMEGRSHCTPWFDAYRADPPAVRFGLEVPYGEHLPRRVKVPGTDKHVAVGKPRELKHLLSGLAFCDVCGSPLRVGRQNAGGKKSVPVLDELGEPVIGSDGRPLKEVAMKQRLDRQMRPVSDERGDPVMVVDRPYYATYICQGTARIAGPNGKKGFHVAMKQDHLDQIVTELLLARLERPDFLASIGSRGSGNDAERKDLLAEIDGHREWLEQVRERAEQERNLDLLFDQQSRVEPKIEAAQRRLEQLPEVDPWILAVLREGAIREAWEDEDRMGIVEKRRLLAAVMAPRVKRGIRGQKGLHPERVLPGWK